MVPSPTPEHNFDEIPVVESADEWWHRKYGYDENGRVVRIATVEEVAQDGSATGVHLPAPSFWPLVLAVGLPFIGYGLIFNLWLACIGGALTGRPCIGWALEPVDDPDADHGHGHDDHDDGHDGDDDDGRRRRPSRSVPAPKEGSDMATATMTVPTPTADGHDDGHDDHGTSTGISNTKLAMWTFLGSECLLFGGLISTYLLYKTEAWSRQAPPSRPTSSTSRSPR